ncbi:MAG: hypothetical protein H6Q90_5288 [Deltaproteobacteria bacterium]|nr:hypothetical protein [Deltaproteobacteria bacterium]
MTWSRRQFSAALGLTPLLACDRGTRTSTKETGVGPTKPTMHYQPAGPGYSRADGPAPFSFDGDELLEVRDGVLIRRDAALAEISRLPLTDVTTFTVLRDRSLAVRVAPAAGAPLLHHLVAGRSKASYASHGKLLAPTEKPNELWEVDDRSVSREQFGTDKLAGMLVPNVTHPLPENTLPGFAAFSDGTIAVSNITAILHADATKLSSYTWAGGSRHLAPGPGPRTLWASDNFDKIALVSLEGTEAKPIARHSLKPDEVLLHLAGSGDHAAAVIARTPDTGPTEFTLAVYTTKGEQWRAPLDSPRQIFYAALSATRVIVRAEPQFLLRAWDLATGKPA